MCTYVYTHMPVCLHLYSTCIVTRCFKVRIIFKLLKRNIYLSHRQLVIGDLGHVKDLSGNAKSSRSNQTFGTNNYLAPEAYDLRRSNKIDIWSFGCIVYELFNLDKLFNIRSPDKLRISIINFRVEEANFNAGKIKPAYIGVVKKYLLNFNPFFCKTTCQELRLRSLKKTFYFTFLVRVFNFISK
jgi:serine/threonine protein kinase